MSDSHLSGPRDDDDTPECLVLSEPARDVYSSDEDREAENEEEHYRCQQAINKMSRLHIKSSRRQTISIYEAIAAHYTYHSPELNYLKSSMDSYLSYKGENPTLAQCLEQLLDFAIEENSQRRKEIKGVKLFDGKTADEIIDFWKIAHPNVKWLLDNFNQNLNKQAQIDDITGKVHKNRVIKTPEDYRNLFTEVNCLSFVQDFMTLIKKFDSLSTARLRVDDWHSRFKPLVTAIATVLHIRFRTEGQCERAVPILPLTKNNPKSVQQTVVTKPDLVFTSSDESVLLPVQICSRRNGEMESSTYKSQHTLQHVGLIYEKIIDLLDYTTPSNFTDGDETSHVSVGMLIKEKTVHLTKVSTTLNHMSSFVKELLPGKIRAQNPEDIIEAMLNNREEDGVIVTESEWNIDLADGLHRNALFVFLVQYFWGHEYFVSRNVKVE